MESAGNVAAYQFSLMENMGWRSLLGDYVGLILVKSIY